MILTDFYLKHLDINNPNQKSLFYANVFMLGIFYGMTIYQSALLNGKDKTSIASKRNIWDKKSVLLISIATGSLIWGLKTDKISKVNRDRLWNFFVLDAAIGVSWNALAYLVGYRWLSRDKDTGKRSPSIIDQIVGLTYDGVIEISAMYSMFLVVVFASMSNN